MPDIPVAFVVFNRPESTSTSFDRIRLARPSHLFVIADGPRSDRPGEHQLVEQARQVVEHVDWPCTVKRFYSDTNMGCGRRVSSGITKALECVDRLIVLEDDCVADLSFFTYCRDLLERYEDDERVMAISGNNHQMGRRRTRASYYFSKFPHCWGWATWRRAWAHFDLQMSDWLSIRQSGQLATFCHSRREQMYWTEMFDTVYEGKLNSWAFPWQLACWVNHGLTALPEVNLVSNIGFGVDATHTLQSSPVAACPTGDLGPIVHPKRVCQNFEADRFTDQLIFSGANRGGPLKRFEKSIRYRRKSWQFEKRHSEMLKGESRSAA